MHHPSIHHHQGAAMETLVDSSLIQQLIFNNLSFSFLAAVNGFWTWIAVLTAVISFWKIRGAGSAAVGFQSHDESDVAVEEFINDDDDQFCQPQLDYLSAEPARRTLSPSSCSCSCSSYSDFDSEEYDGTVRGKFTVYYETGDSSSSYELCCDNNGSSSYEDDLCSVSDADQAYGWEGIVLVRKMRDLGWYGSQDLKVLDGSIVRLWEGVKKRNSSCLLGGSLCR